MVERKLVSDKKIYPSGSAFLMPDGVATKYNSGCPRFVVLSVGSVRKEIHPIYAKLGAVHEDWYAEQLGGRLKHRELPVKFALQDGIEVSGRIDFVDMDGDPHETKATMSKNALYDMRKGKVQIGHLAQLVGYMIYTERTKGYIAVGFYKHVPLPDHMYNFERKETRVFTITINEDGDILADEQHTGYNTLHHMRFTKLIEKVLQTKEISPRPLPGGFITPCTFCPLKSLCDSYDKGDIDETTLRSEALELLNKD